MTCFSLLSAFLLGLFAQIQAHLVLDPAVEAVLSRRATSRPAGPVLKTPREEDDTAKFHFLGNLTAPFWVDGTSVPDVPFDIGESYAGQMPLTEDADEKRNMFFWFFPMQSDNPREEKDMIIWLNGGPGCTSMLGLLGENGPFLWPPGTFRPVRNPWSWHRLAHIVYVDQPIGTGYSTGPITAADEDDVAREFLLFWRRFVETFQLNGSRVYLTGESYAGMYVPYIALHMLDAQSDERAGYFDVRGALLFDPLIGDKTIQSSVPAVRFIEKTAVLHPFNDSFAASIKVQADRCGFSAYLDKYLTYPPPSEPQPSIVPGKNDMECDLLRMAITLEALDLNPCWSPYNVASMCPLQWSVMDLDGTSSYLPEGTERYFARDDVKRAVNVHNMSRPWAECIPFGSTVFAGSRSGQDNSSPSTAYALPSVIEHTGNVIIAHGGLDFILPADGTLLAIQNMTWSGMRGFQRPPTEPLIVPAYNPSALLASVGGDLSKFDAPDRSGVAGSGRLGVAHEERGLTYVGVGLSGHMMPMFAPSAAMRMVEVLLGKTRDLGSDEPFVLERTRTV